MNRNRRGNVGNSNVFTLLLPIGIALLILIVVIRGFSSIWSQKTSDKNNGSAFVEVTPKNDAKASIYMSSDAWTELSQPSKMYPSDKKLRVDSGDVSVTIEGSTSKIELERLSEIHYDGVIDGKHSFTLLNGYAWVDSPNGDVVIHMNLFDVIPKTGTVYIAYQNTLASNVYTLKGSADVKSAKSEANVSIGQMLTLLSSEADNATIGTKVAPLDDFIKQTTIFVKWDGASLLASSNTESNGNSGTGSFNTNSGSTSSGVTSSEDNESFIVFTSPEDNETVDTNAITIEGKLLNSHIGKVTINGKEVQLLTSEKAFELKNFTLTDAVNDLSYRVYDTDGILKKKWVITVNYSGKKTTVQKPSVVSFPVSNKDFKITAPGENPYKTTDDNVKIRGSFAPNLVKYITINDYRLKQFKENGTSWTYNASIEYGNMNEGINEYIIAYYGPSDEVLATTKYIIVKEKKVETPTPEATTPSTEKTSTTTATPAKTTSGSTNPL